jgi:psp operon transcriptional activator
VRELKNVVERSVYRWQAPEEPLDDIVFDPFASPFRPSPHINETQRENSATALTPPKISVPVDLKAVLRDLEIGFTEQALAAAHYNQRQAAELLGLTYHQLRGVLRKYALNGTTRHDEHGMR